MDKIRHTLKRDRKCCYLTTTVLGEHKVCLHEPEYTMHVKEALRENGAIYEGQTHHLYSCRHHVEKLLRTKEFSKAEKWV